MRVLRLAKLVLHVEARRDVLPPLSVRQTYHKGEQERKHKQVMGELVGTDRNGTAALAIAARLVTADVPCVTVATVATVAVAVPP